MAETTYFPRRLILAGAMISGVLLALAVHMLGRATGSISAACGDPTPANSCRRVRPLHGG